MGLHSLPMRGQFVALAVLVLPLCGLSRENTGPRWLVVVAKPSTLGLLEGPAVELHQIVIRADIPRTRVGEKPQSRRSERFRRETEGHVQRLGREHFDTPLAAV